MILSTAATFFASLLWAVKGVLSLPCVFVPIGCLRMNLTDLPENKHLVLLKSSSFCQDHSIISLGSSMPRSLWRWVTDIFQPQIEHWHMPVRASPLDVHFATGPLNPWEWWHPVVSHGPFTVEAWTTLLIIRTKEQVSYVVDLKVLLTALNPFSTKKHRFVSTHILNLS